jgi:SpoVK/Ycf46/Vps4 family AAA+-type ATPase
VPERDNPWREDRYGFLRWCVLPDESWAEWWDRIHVDPDLKRRLRAHANFSLRHREEFSPVGLPVHGLALLYGPPGAGKSSLVRGLANVVAGDLIADGFTDQVIFAEIDPHTLPSQMLGESQRNTINLLEKSLPEIAAKGYPVIVGIDEINSLAVRRGLAAGGRDPVDVMRATEAVLRGLDYLAGAHRNIYIVGTSNFVATIDEALYDRVDVAFEIRLPDTEQIVSILEDTFAEFPKVEIEPDELQELAAALGGHSGRDIRKTVLEAVVTRSTAADEPLRARDISAVIREATQ